VKEEVQKRKSTILPEPDIPGLYRFGDTRNACSDTSKIKSIGWEPKYSPKDSVKEYIDWLYQQRNIQNIFKFAEKTMKRLNVIRSKD
jgi:dTDP-L-rhamnose 4-epimerase